VLNATESKNRIEELADVLEILTALGKIENASLDDIIKLMNEKQTR
jgi:predicted house-cleaning noncanonical NTP pyrophosphatase (MazG superfamily)